MPIYEYACTACGERVEVKQRFDEPPLQECEFCGGRLRKLFSPVGVVFKGSGFYSTDYGRGGRRRDGKEGEGAPSEGKAEGQADKADKPDKVEKVEKKPAEA